MRVSIVSLPAKRSEASIAVSASGDWLARSSIARRISSAQSRSSGVIVTRPSSRAAPASSGSPMADLQRSIGVASSENRVAIRVR